MSGRSASAPTGVGNGHVVVEEERPPRLLPEGFEQLKPGPGRDREKVGAHQRARLQAAMVAACSGRGYERTTVRELVRTAGVSAKTLYVHYDGKEGCLLAAYDGVVSRAAARVGAAYGGKDGEKGGWEAALERALDAFARELAEDPQGARLALVDVRRVGAAAERVARTETMIAGMLRGALERPGDDARVPPALWRALVGGMAFVAAERVRAGEAEALAGWGRELCGWLGSYRLPSGARLPEAPRVLEARGSGRRRLGAGAAERARVLEAAAAVFARRGLGGLSRNEVADVAGITPREMEAHFPEMSACSEAMVQWLTADAVAYALRCAEDAAGWRAGLCQVVDALLWRLAADPALARAVFVDCGDGVRGSEDVSKAIVGGFANLLARRSPQGLRPSGLGAELTVASAWSLAQRQMLAGGLKSLPALSGATAFLAMAPMVGAGKAVEAIAAAAA